MKQLIILIGIILFGITAKAQPAPDPNTVCMPTSVAKKIAEDLLIGDSAKASLYNTIEELGLTKDKLSYKDSLIVIGKIKELNYNEQIKNEQIQKKAYMALFEESKKQYADLSKQYRRYKVKKTITDFLFTGGIIAVTGAFIYRYTK
jgi:hypothetical protein